MQQRLVVVIGATATGKSRLGVELGKLFGGEVVNCDAMQIFKGLDIATAKVTSEEMEGVPHHMFGCSEVVEGTFGPIKYRDTATEVIKDISSRGSLPILVGGTLYYMQSLLWDALLDKTPSYKPDTKSQQSSTQIPPTWEELHKVDPVTAAQLHPQNTRKIRRALEVYHTVGKKYSDLLAEQKETKVLERTNFDTLIFWLDCEKEVHHTRMRDRIDRMVEAGLIKEVKEFIQSHEHETDSSGLYQSIGYKEFIPFFEGKMSLQEAKESLFISHRQYAKWQNKWIQKKVLTKNIPVYKLDTTDTDSWDTNVLLKAERITRAFLTKQTIDEASENVAHVMMDMERFECARCNKVMFGRDQYESHMRSRGHRRVVKKGQ